MTISSFLHLKVTEQFGKKCQETSSKGENFMKNPDTRVQFTRNALKQALLTLMEEKNVDKITVKELCRDCRHQPWHLLSPLRQPLCPVGGHRKPVSGGKSRHFPLLLEDPARPEPDDRTLSVHPKERRLLPHSHGTYRRSPDSPPPAGHHPRRCPGRMAKRIPGICLE